MPKNISNSIRLSVGPNGPVIPKISGNDVGAQIDFLPNFTGNFFTPISLFTS